MTPSEETPRFIQRFRTVIETINWTTLLAGVAIGMVGLQLLSGRSLNQRLNSVESELGLVRSSLDEVAGARGDVEQANGLLATLVQQQRRVETARASLDAIDRFTADVSASSAAADEAQAALARLVSLNNDLIATGEQRDRVADAIDGVRELHDRVTEVGADSRQVATRLKDAELALNQLHDLQQRVVATTAELEQARAALDALTALQCDLAGTDVSTTQARAAAERLIALAQNVNAGVDQIESAEANTERLIALKDDIVTHGDGLQTAERNVERLIAMQDQLVTDERLQFLEAASNVERLIRIQAEIASQTDSLVDSITALELLGDFQSEFNDQAAGVREMRRQLTELILLQTTIEQALQIVEPISDLGNLRRLDPREIRQAARMILDQRRERLAGQSDPADIAAREPVPTAAADGQDETDGEASELEIHSPEIHRPVPVPPEESDPLSE